MRKLAFLNLMLLFFLCSCSNNKEKVLKIQASSMPQAEILEQIVGDMKEEGITLEIIVIDDYNIPNRALANGEIDANFFQHKPFLDEQVKEFSYPICVLTEVHIEPMGIYSKKKTLDTLEKGDLITLPSDPTNEDRALRLLEKANLITLKPKSHSLTLLDIASNPRGLKFQEVDSAFLTRTLDDADAAVIPTNYALLIGLSPQKDALTIEDSSSFYVNVIAIQSKDVENLPEKLAILKKVMESEKVANYILTKYQGAVIPIHHSVEEKK